jgi:hypothetical protein
MISLGLRFSLIGVALAVWGTTRLLVPVYRSRPEILLEPVSLLLPPGLLGLSAAVVSAFAAFTLVETEIYRRRRGSGFRPALERSLRSSEPLLILLLFALLFFPGARFLPLLSWWLVLDAGNWVLSLSLLATAYRKRREVAEAWPMLFSWFGSWCRSRSAAVFALALFAVLALGTPQRRFSQPYDERWGTGDEPRYIRIAASLLHDQDADISNAELHIGRPASLASLLKGVLGWPRSTVATLLELGPLALGRESTDLARSLGGQVIQGRHGGTYYVYLPGFPLLLTPAMALDSWFFPGRLPLVVFTCLGLAVLLTLSVSRLVEPVLGNGRAALALSGGLALAVPLLHSAFQVYPETAAALGLAVLLRVVLFSPPGWRSAVVFGVAGALLPWLHTKYLVIWAVSLVAFGWKARHGAWGRARAAAGLGPALFSLGLHCLYVFHISGSLLPDALWVLNGYPRGLHLLHPEAGHGLYYLLLDRREGLLVYAPFFALAIPGALALRQRWGFAFGLTGTIFVLYVLAAASHDLGGAGGWSPPARYFVVMTPILGLWLAAWLARPGEPVPRWAILVAGLAASFWMARAMLAEPNWMYDRPAFLAGGVIDPSPALGSLSEPSWIARLAYPTFLAALLLFFAGWECRESRRRSAARLFSAGATALIVVAVVLVDARRDRSAWMASASRERARPLLVRPGRPLAVSWVGIETGSCELRLAASTEQAAARLAGPGYERRLEVPSGAPSRLRPEPRPVNRRRGRGHQESLYWVEVSVEPGRGPLKLEVICR